MPKRTVFISSVQLPAGMTIERIKGIHRSRPVNPTLANPVYLTGYIEQMGTGTTDIIERCEKAGLRTPEFIQDEDFTTILWRPKEQATDKVIDQVTGQVTGQVTDQVRRLILVVRGDTKTREEIMNLMRLKHRRNFRLAYIIPAIEAGYLTMLYPDKPNSSNQAYYLTPKGLELLKKLKS